MKRYALALLVFTIPVLRTHAQADSIRAVIYRVADNIIANTNYKFVNDKAQSRYNKWEYANGVMMIGMQKVAKDLGKKEYADYVYKNYDFVFKNAPHYKELYARDPHTEFAPFFRMNALDDCGAMAAALADANEHEKNPQYREYLDRVGDYILHRQSRLDDGTLCRTFPRKMTIWADDLYMSVPFLARMGRVTGDNKYFDDAIKQVLNFTKHLYDPATGLYFHCWFSDVELNGVAHWLRCNGWLAMAQVELLNNLPANHPQRNQLIQLLTRQLVGMARYQDQGGLWHQVMDRPDSYLETSGTAMFVYAVARAVNEKWIPSTYRSIAIEGWKQLTQKVRPDGGVEDVCIGTGIADNISFYYNRPKVLNDFHVSGAILLAGTEMLRLK
jgi:unsaturated rhamnogalacturonyl hydrolase